MKEKKIHMHWLLLTAGILWIFLGTVAFAGTTVSYWMIVKYSGLALLMDGLLMLGLSFSKGQYLLHNWRIAESVVDISFSIFLLLDPIFSIFAFPFIIIPWMAVKGSIKAIGAIFARRRGWRWGADLTGGLLLVGFSILIPHDPIEQPHGIRLLVCLLGWTVGAIYCYDFFRMGPTTDHNQVSC
jgi:uncharacterized membrane protein HdeD (DUF308 family)